MVLLVAAFLVPAAFLGAAFLVAAFLVAAGFFVIFLVFLAPEAALVVLALGALAGLVGDGDGDGDGDEATGATTASAFLGVAAFLVALLGAAFLVAVFLGVVCVKRECTFDFDLEAEAACLAILYFL